MVPFYGQGMNCGFQDVHILDEVFFFFFFFFFFSDFNIFSKKNEKNKNQILQKHPKNTSLALQEYSKTRNPDAEAICDLAMDNYIEMRSTVTFSNLKF